MHVKFTLVTGHETYHQFWKEFIIKKGGRISTLIIVCINALCKVYTKAIGFSHFELILTGKQRIRVKVVFIMGVYKQWTGLLEWWTG